MTVTMTPTMTPTTSASSVSLITIRRVLDYSTPIILYHVV